MDEEKTGVESTQDEDYSGGLVDKTQKTVRLIGKIIIGALAAALAAEALSFRKKE